MSGFSLGKLFLGIGEIVAGVLLTPFSGPLGGGLIATGLGTEISVVADLLRVYSKTSLEPGNPYTALPVVYGYQRVAPTVIFRRDTADNNYRWLVLALCHGPIYSIDEIYFDGHLAVDYLGVVENGAAGTSGGIPVDQIAPIDYTGLVAGGKYFGGDQQGDTPDATLQGGGDHNVTFADLRTAFPGVWTTAMQGRGVACLLLRLKWDQDKFGHEPAILVSLRGRTLYDPRAATKTITSSSAASPTVITATGHGLSTGDMFQVTGHAGAVTDDPLRATLDGQYCATVTGADTLTVPYNVTVGGTGGTLQKLAYATTPALVQRDYLTSTRYGVGALSSEIDDTAVSAMATAEDTVVRVPQGTGEKSVESTNAGTNLVKVTAHGWLTGEIVWIRDYSGTTPDLNGEWTITVSDADHFSLDTVTITVGTSTPSGTVQQTAVAGPSGRGLKRILGVSTSVLHVEHHGYSNGDLIYIQRNTGASANLNGLHTVTVVDADHFSLGVAVTGTNTGTVEQAIPQATFSANGLVDTSQTLKDNLDRLLSANRGNLTWQGGGYRLWTRRAASPTTFALTEDNIIGDWTWTLPSAAQSPNVVRAAWVNPDYAYWQPEPADWPLPGSTNTFLADDNGLLVMAEVALPFTTNRYMAEQIAMVLRREGRAQITVQLTATEAALAVQVGDVVPVTHSTPGWVAKAFWVTAMGIGQNGQVRLSLMEYAATAYDYDKNDDAPKAPETVLPNPWQVQPPVAIAPGTGPLLTTGTGDPRIKVQWGASTDLFVARYEIQARRSDDLNWREFGFVTADTLTAFVGTVADGEVWTVRVRSVNTLGRRGLIGGNSTPADGWLSATTTVSLLKSPQFTYDDDADDTSVTYNITFGVNCEWVDIYSRVNAASGGPNPLDTEAWRSGHLQRPAGSGMVSQRIATNAAAGAYVRSYLIPLSADMVRGTPVGPLELHASASLTPPSHPPTTLAAVPGDNDVALTWDNNADVLSVTRVYLDGLVVFITAVNATSYDVTGLLSARDYQFDIDHLRNGQFSTRNGVVSATTTSPTCATPTYFEARGGMCGDAGDPEMGFTWQLNQPGAVTVVEESLVGDFSDAVVVVTGTPGASSAVSNAHSSGTYTFRCHSTLAGYSDSANSDPSGEGWLSAPNVATYGACDPAIPHP